MQMNYVRDLFFLKEPTVQWEMLEGNECLKEVNGGNSKKISGGKKKREVHSDT